MQGEVSAKSAVTTAQAVRAATINIWKHIEEQAGAAAAEAERDPEYKVTARWLAETEAMRQRPIRVWDVCETPDDGQRRWVLAPRFPDGEATEIEGAQAAQSGDLVVEPGDDEGRIVAKLKRARFLRSQQAAMEGAR
jgi:hypothetical protein